MRWWKAVGLAGAVGVVATGAVVARSERRRRAYTPDEIRAQLHDRLAEGSAAESSADESSESFADEAAARTDAEPTG